MYHFTFQNMITFYGPWLRGLGLNLTPFASILSYTGIYMSGSESTTLHTTVCTVHFLFFDMFAFGIPNVSPQHALYNSGKMVANFPPYSGKLSTSPELVGCERYCVGFSEAADIPESPSSMGTNLN